MKATIAICTWNRARLLKGVLESISKLKIFEGADWEVLVVNNNSSDETESVSFSFKEKLPLRYVFEPKAGLSHARNTAIRDALGEYIIFIDDDVLLHENWLQAYLTAFSEHPDASVFAGPIQPVMEGKAPAWMGAVLSKTGVAYAALDYGSASFQLTSQKLPFGANMVFRASDLTQNAFDPKLGRVAGSMIGYEEIILLKHLLSEGTGWWVPGAHLQHVIPAERQTIKYLRRYWKGAGRSVIRVGYGGSLGKGFTVFGSKLWVWKQAIWGEFRYHFNRLFSKPEVWIVDLIQSSDAWGRIHEGLKKNRHE